MGKRNLKKQGKILSLNNGEKYLVIDEVENAEKHYLLLSSLNNIKDVKICLINQNYIEEIIDEKTKLWLLRKLLKF